MEDQPPVLHFKIPGTVGNMPYELLIFEDRLVFIGSYRNNRKTFLYKDIRRIRIQNDPKGRPRMLNIAFNSGTWELLDLGFSNAGEKIIEYIEARLK